MCWEWGRLTRTRAGHRYRPRMTAIDRQPAAACGGDVAAVVLVVLGKSRLGAGCSRCRRGWTVRPVAAASRSRPLALLYVGLPAFVLVWLRQDADYGLAAVLYLFLAVWVTDIAAYAAGRTLGGPKLAPSISPGKTWTA